MLQKKESTGKILFHASILLISCSYFLTAFSLGMPVVDSQIKPSFFPIVIGLLSIIFSVILLRREMKKEGLQITTISQESDETSNKKASERPAYLIIAATAVYILAFSQVGYLLSSALYVFAVMIIFSNKEKVWQKLIVAIITAGLGYLIFEQMFGVQLPVLWE